MKYWVSLDGEVYDRVFSPKELVELEGFTSETMVCPENKDDAWAQAKEFPDIVEKLSESDTKTGNTHTDQRRTNRGTQTSARSTKQESILELDIGQFFTFEKMLTPTLISILFVLGLLGVIFLSGIFFYIGLQTGRNSIILIGLLFLIMAPIGLRVICESMIVLFRILEELKE